MSQKFITISAAAAERVRARWDAALAAARETVAKAQAKAKETVTTFLTNINRFTAEGPKLLDRVPQAAAEFVLVNIPDENAPTSLTRILGLAAQGIPVPEDFTPPEKFEVQTNRTARAIRVKFDGDPKSLVSPSPEVTYALGLDDDYEEYPLPSVEVPNKVLIGTLGKVLCNLGTDLYFVPEARPENAVDLLLNGETLPLGTVYSGPAGYNSLPTGAVNVALEVLPSEITDASLLDDPKERWAAILEAMETAEGTTTLTCDELRLIAPILKNTNLTAHRVVVG